MMVRLNNTKEDIKYIVNFFNVKRFVYLILIFILLAHFFTVLQNLSIVLFTYNAIGLSAVFSYIEFTLIGVIFHNNIFSAIIFVLTILALSIYLEMFVSKFREGSGVKTAGLGIISGIITFLGLGCVSCGGIVLVSVLGTLGVTGVISFLPLDGFGIQALALIVSVISLFVFVRKARQKVCKI